MVLCILIWTIREWWCLFVRIVIYVSIRTICICVCMYSTYRIWWNPIIWLIVFFGWQLFVLDVAHFIYIYRHAWNFRNHQHRNETVVREKRFLNIMTSVIPITTVTKVAWKVTRIKHSTVFRDSIFFPCCIMSYLALQESYIIQYTISWFLKRYRNSFTRSVGRSNITPKQFSNDFQIVGAGSNNNVWLYRYAFIENHIPDLHLIKFLDFIISYFEVSYFFTICIKKYIKLYHV